jgi:hypothetical protein
MTDLLVQRRGGGGSSEFLKSSYLSLGRCFGFGPGAAPHGVEDDSAE